MEFIKIISDSSARRGEINPSRLCGRKYKSNGMKACFQSPTKHEAKPKQACLISVACRLAKCQLNEVKMKIENHSPLEGESNEQGFSEVRLVGG